MYTFSLFHVLADILGSFDEKTYKFVLQFNVAFFNITSMSYENYSLR